MVFIPPIFNNSDRNCWLKRNSKPLNYIETKSEYVHANVAILTQYIHIPRLLYHSIHRMRVCVHVILSTCLCMSCTLRNIRLHTVDYITRLFVCVYYSQFELAILYLSLYKFQCVFVFACFIHWKKTLTYLPNCVYINSKIPSYFGNSNYKSVVFSKECYV